MGRYLLSARLGSLLKGSGLFFGGGALLFASYTPPMWGKSDREMRRRRAEMLYEFETALRDMGETSEFVYDEEHALYR